MELFHLLLLSSFSLLLLPTWAQLAPSEGRILLQLEQLLEHPPPLQGWTNWTSFCYLPPSPSVSILCSSNHVTELTVTGNRTSPLSNGFSIDTFFTVLTKLTRLKVLSLVSLGLWGPFPVKINRLMSLQVLNLTSNFISGQIPPEIGSLGELNSLVLPRNLLNGSLPNLSMLPFLEELDLSSNVLGPEFPSLGDKLVTLVLRNNVFRSPLPSQLNNFDHLEHLDISFNQIVGPIPPTVFSLPLLHYLNLSENRLSGAVPTNISCSGGLEFVAVSCNFLIGEVLPCSGSKISSQVMIYSWNCLSLGDQNYQHPYSFCHKEALAVKPLKREHENGSNTKLGLIFGIAGAMVGCIGAMGFLVLAAFRRREAMKVESSTLEKSVSRKASLRFSPGLLTEPRVVSPAMRFGAIGLPPYHVFSMEEIEEATYNFDPSNSMGQGSQAQLYKGWFRDGCTIAVKCFKLQHRHSPQSMLQHMELISKFRHHHVVSVLGHCIVFHQDYPNATNTFFLVFEYVSNGTLRSHLSDRRKRDLLKWPQRIAIMIGIAKGVEFLHAGISPGIFGNDLKMEHILLDENLRAKIHNYNIPMPSKLDSERSLVGVEIVDHLGSSMRTIEHVEKEDIYQLGAILLEIITGKPITTQRELDSQRFQLEQSLVDAPPKLNEFADHTIRGTFAHESLRTASQITISCLSEDPNERPSIEDVVWNLQYSLQVQDGWTISSEIHS